MSSGCSSPSRSWLKELSAPPGELWPLQLCFPFCLPTLAAIPLPPTGLGCKAREGSGIASSPRALVKDHLIQLSV